MADEDPKHTAFLRTLVCAVAATEGYFTPEHFGCEGSVAVHHATYGRGMGQRAHDHLGIPLCMKHHTQFHLGLGYFVDWNHERRTEWQKNMVKLYKPKDLKEVF